MRSVSLVLLLVVIAMASAAPASSKPHYDVSNAAELFKDYVTKYGKSYKDDADKEAHFKAFVESLEQINKLNSDDKGTATFDLNKFSDYTDEEKQMMFGLKKKDH